MILEIKKKKENETHKINKIIKENESRLKKAKTQLERNAIKNSIIEMKDKLKKLK